MPRPDSYRTLSEAVNDLQHRGFKLDFNLLNDGLADNEGRFLSPDDFEIVEFYRFEGQSDPGDMSIVYGIESKDGLRGVLVNGYGMSGDGATTHLIEKLKVAQPQTPVGYEQPQAEHDTGLIEGTAGQEHKYDPTADSSAPDGPAGGNIGVEDAVEGRR